jgi:DNA polymerase-3 subunit gamma/tau
MQLASITSNGEKKKNSHYILPPDLIQTAVSSGDKEAVETINHTPISSEASAAPERIKEQEAAEIPENKEPEPIKPTATITIKKPVKATSGLSLKSIREKKAHQIKQMDVVIDEEDLPKKEVKQEDLLTYWNEYARQLQTKGELILASIMSMEDPTIKGSEILLSYSNSTNKIELEKAQYPLLSFLRKSLENYDLSLNITVNEEVATKYAFTPQEKYMKLKEKNSNIELLKKTFGLDV